MVQGYILTSEIDGTIQMKSYLTGNPEIRLALNEDLSIGRSQGPAYGIFFEFWLFFISSFPFSFTIDDSCLGFHFSIPRKKKL